VRVRLARVRIAELWRYPVKSLQGERLEVASVGAAGLEGDRCCAIFDASTGLGLTGRRVPELLFASARIDAESGLVITLPDGSPARDDEQLSAWLGRAVRLQSAERAAERRYENPDDYEHEATSPWQPYTGADGPFHDTSEARVSLVSRASIGDWDARRFRANVVLDGAGEDDLVGSTVTLGGARLEIRERIPRCVMTTRPQPGGIDRDLDVLRTIAREREACLAVGAIVASPGLVRVGDELATE
jgi:uncharacterized protein YcbX